ncbi:MAG: metallopeptidase TldD-related protein [Myxococcota bacterium]|nr:metallopeptidase TldD-related protein [Myxococcota bacterium]
MIKRRDLTRALDRKRVADWAVYERMQDIAIADAVRREKLMRRREQRIRMTFLVHVDDSRGRGTARVEVGSQDDKAGDIVDRAIELALASVGPSWKSVPASAPAKVNLLDPAIATRDLQDIALGIAGRVRAPQPATVVACARVAREEIVLDTRAGLSAKWALSTYELDALVADSKHSLLVHREGRREADLELDAAITSAAADLALLATAGPVKSGPCALVLDANAFLHDDMMGVWSVFATQADAVLERQGLTRYRVGVPVAPGADTVSEPLWIESNGALDFGTRSAPIGEDGDAIRKFNIVERGIAKDLGLTPREAALRGRDPNGGVRNLKVSTGTWDGTLPNKRTIEVRRLRGLTIDAYTGEASLELAISIDNGEKKQTFTGGTIRLDLIAALSLARRAATTIRRGAYLGPSRLLIDDAHLVV